MPAVRDVGPLTHFASPPGEKSGLAIRTRPEVISSSYDSPVVSLALGTRPSPSRGLDRTFSGARSRGRKPASEVGNHAGCWDDAWDHIVERSGVFARPGVTGDLTAPFRARLGSNMLGFQADVSGAAGSDGAAAERLRSRLRMTQVAGTRPSTSRAHFSTTDSRHEAGPLALTMNNGFLQRCHPGVGDSRQVSHVAVPGGQVVAAELL